MEESDSTSSDEPYFAEAEYACRVLKERTSDNRTEWNKWKDQDEMSCYHSITAEGRSIWRVEMTVHASVEKVVLYLGEDTNIPEWNPTVRTIKVIKHVDSMTAIVCTESVATGPFPAREVVYVRKAITVDSSHYIAITSVDCEQQPVKEGIVRAGVGPSGFKIIPIGSNQVRLVWISETDSKMPFWVPASLLDYAYAHVLMQAAHCLVDKLSNSVQ